MIIDERWPFFTVDIELTNHCAQNCLFCPREKITRPKGFMDLAILQALVKQLAQTGSRVTFCGMGTPLLYPHLQDAGKICREAGLKYGITIQAPALDEEGIIKICAFEPAFIEVSLPTIDADLFKKIYPGQLLEGCLTNINNLEKARGSSRGLNIVCVSTGAEKVSNDETRAFWKARGLNCRIMQCHSRGGNLKLSGLATAVPAPVEKCGLFASHAFITWQGRLLACCHDLSGETEIADLQLIAVKEAGARKQTILNDRMMPWPICSNCDEPASARLIPDRPFPESDKARSRFLKRLARM